MLHEFALKLLPMEKSLPLVLYFKATRVISKPLYYFVLEVQMTPTIITGNGCQGQLSDLGYYEYVCYGYLLS